MSSEGSDSAERRAGWARAGQYDTTHLGGSRRTARRAYEDLPSVPHEPIPGRALATRRAVMDIVRAATLGSYGVAGFAGGPVERALAFLEGRPPGLHVDVAQGELAIRLDLRVAYGLPVAEVARQVESAIRYGVRRAVGREVDSLQIRVGGLNTPPGTPPPTRHPSPGPGSSDLADSGTDVA